MFSQLERLTRSIDGRYASDAELQFLAVYLRSYSLRVQTYQKLQELEAAIVQETYSKVRAIDSQLFYQGQEDISIKWKRDTTRVLRYVAAAVLSDDPQTFRQRFLLWFQSIMRSFGTQKSCDITYKVLQSVMENYLAAAQAELVLPLLEMTRQSLGGSVRRN